MPKQLIVFHYLFPERAAVEPEIISEVQVNDTIRYVCNYVGIPLLHIKNDILPHSIAARTMPSRVD